MTELNEYYVDATVTFKIKATSEDEAEKIMNKNLDMFPIVDLWHTDAIEFIGSYQEKKPCSNRKAKRKHRK